jgi:lysophospholipase L1-like esterase
MSTTGPMSVSPVLAANLPWAAAAVSLALLSAASLFAASYDYDVHTTQELRARDGLPNFLAKAEAGGTVRVAYMGGSITAAAGWRPKTLSWLRQQYPKATFTEINAAISGTGSDFGASRLQEDVLKHDPDLVFLEFRVNGGGGFEAKSMEGIARQIWRKNPATDICFIYTVCEWMMPNIRQGKNEAYDSFGAIMEGIANRYGIPTIELGLEVARQEKTGELIFKADKPIEGKLVFSADGVHPGDAGHDLYRDVIARSILAMKGVGQAGPHALGEPLTTGPWETATMLPIGEATLTGGWTPVDMAKDPVTGADAGRTKGMLRDARRCDRPGESITMRFNGTAVAFTDVPSVEPIVIEVTIDGGAPATVARLSSEKIRLYARYWRTPELAPGDHTLKLTVKALPEGTAFYAGQF